MKSTKGISKRHTEFHFYQGHQCQYGLSQCSKQSFSEKHVQIGASVRLEFCSQAESDTQTDRQTHRQTALKNISPPRFRGGVKIHFKKMLTN